MAAGSPVRRRFGQGGRGRSLAELGTGVEPVGRRGRPGRTRFWIVVRMWLGAGWVGAAGGPLPPPGARIRNGDGCRSLGPVGGRCSFRDGHVCQRVARRWWLRAAPQTAALDSPRLSDHFPSLLLSFKAQTPLSKRAPMASPKKAHLMMRSQNTRKQTRRKGICSKWLLRMQMFVKNQDGGDANSQRERQPFLQVN